MALYDTRFGLPQGVADYLNQALPDISNLYTPPVAGINPIKPDPDDPEGIISLYPQVAASGDGFSPYSIDPRDVTIRTSDQYNPYAYRQAAESRYVGDLYPTETGLQKQMSMYPDYYGVQGRTLTGIEQLMSKIPTPLGFIKRGIDALADKLPVNRTAIFQNELLGQGFKLDNIGRIVTDNYNTPEGIMAGYNPVSGGLLNMLTGGKYGEPTTYGLDKSYDQRRETIADTLRDKYGMSEPEITAALKGEYTGPVKTPLINRLSLLNKSQEMLNTRKQMADIVTKREEEKRAKEEQQRQQQRTREIAEANKAAGDRGGYQSSWGQDRGGGDFMGGKGTSAEMGSF
jgi:hypothetical protein